MAKRKTAPVLTWEQKLNKEYERLVQWEKYHDPIPAPRRLYGIGDKVDMGNLDDCTVVQVRDGGRVVLFSYLVSPTRDEPDPGGRREIYARYWFDLFPHTTEGGQRAAIYTRDPFLQSYSQTHLEYLITLATTGQIKDSPDYQRGYVWTEADKKRFIASAMTGLDLGKFVLMEYPFPDCRKEIVDGKQRISAIRDFVLGDIDYLGMRFFELPRMDRHHFQSRLIQFVCLNGETVKRSDVLRLFLEINCAGVPQTEAHLAHVRELYLNALVDEGGPRSDGLVQIGPTDV